MLKFDQARPRFVRPRSAQIDFRASGIGGDSERVDPGEGGDVAFSEELDVARLLRVMNRFVIDPACARGETVTITGISGKAHLRLAAHRGS